MILIDCEFVQLPQIIDNRGSLSFFESLNHLKFSVQRTSIYYDIFTSKKQEYSCKEQQEFIVALSGNVDVQINNGFKKKNYSLSCPNEGLYIPNMIWRKFIKTSPNLILLIVGSGQENNNICFEDFDEFYKKISIEK